MPSTQDDDFDPKKCEAEFDFAKFDFAEFDHTPPITAAAPSNASVWAEMNAAKTSIQNRIKDLMQSDPILSKFKSKNYGVQVNATPYMKAKEGAGKVYEAIIGHILTQSGAVKSQTQIRDYVAAMFPSHTVPKDWTKPVPSWAVKKARQRIRGSAAPISSIQLPKAVTLSQLHKAAAAAMERHKTGAQTFKPVVEIRDTSVVINGTVFPIGENKVKGEIYKQMRASMPKFLEALSSRK